jgi:GT2 family glycosyltransferase
MTGPDDVAASVVVPTIGRVALLAGCVRSLLSCRPSPAQIVVVDQSHRGQVEEAMGDLGDERIEVVPDEGRGIARATNRGVAAGRHEITLVTHDDCTVAPDWVGRAAGLVAGRPDVVFTGRVLAPDRAEYVPSTISDVARCDYTGRVTSGVLYPANMAFSRGAMIDFGGFDERPGLMLAAEDNDFCYRWLAAGRPLVYEPDLVVWHHDWRTPDELRRTHMTYARGQGAFYAKHLMARDRRILPLLRWDLARAARSTIVGPLRCRPRWQDPYREMLWSLLAGMAEELWGSRRSAVR